MKAKNKEKTNFCPIINILTNLADVLFECQDKH